MDLRPKIGIFDSGIGGLTVLSECVKRAPFFTYYYYGDNKKAPYGGRSRKEITEFVRIAMREFEERGVDAAVLACNTATAVCAEEMRREFSFPIIGMEPAVKLAGKQCRHALVLATERTAESARLKNLLVQTAQCEFTVFPAPRLAGAIEAHLTFGEKLTLSDHLPKGNFDGVVLGCTHYIYFRREIADFYAAPVFDGNAGTAKRLLSLWESGKIGKADHREFQKTNVCSYQNMNKTVKNRVFFVGSGGKLNENLYKSEQMFQ